MATRVTCVCRAGPSYAAQQLNRYEITQAHSLHFDGNIDQAIGLHHGRQDSRTLRTSRSNHEHTIFPSQHAAEEMASVRPF